MEILRNYEKKVLPLPSTSCYVSKSVPVKEVNTLRGFAPMMESPRLPSWLLARHWSCVASCQQNILFIYRKHQLYYPSLMGLNCIQIFSFIWTENNQMRNTKLRRHGIISKQKNTTNAVTLMTCFVMFSPLNVWRECVIDESMRPDLGTKTCKTRHSG